MDKQWQTIIWQQFGAAIDMLGSALNACPSELWQAQLYNDRSVQPEFTAFWYVTYHTIFWLDFYLADSIETFSPPPPFTLSEFEAGLLPERVYTKAELQSYLAYSRQKCQETIHGLTNALAPQRCRTDWPEMSVAELLLYNMRHVQEHAGQLSLFLGQKEHKTAVWVSKARQ
ncbi:MAG: DinB family protein [Ardenticatenaceae bacterium]|nr:DinB family protein [Ardenticatenaceae bacterium]